MYFFVVRYYRYVTLAFDEMKIQGDVVFSKSSGEIIGFVDYGEQSLDKRFQELQAGFAHW